jgi:hypothetical protein
VRTLSPVRPWIGLGVSIAFLLAAGCAGESDTEPAATDAGDAVDTVDAPPPAPLVFCEGSVAFTWDPAERARLDAFPDDTYTRADPDTATGLRVDITTDTAPWLGAQPPPSAIAFEALNSLDGWGTSSAAFLRFDGPVSPPPSGPETSDDASLLFLAQGQDGWEAVPYEASRLDDDQTLFLRPMRPLEARTAHAIVVTTDYPAADGDCIRPGPALESVLRGEGGDSRLLEALADRGVVPDAVSAATVFTTQSIVDTSVAVSQDIAGREYAWSEVPTCVDEGAGRRCEGRFTAYDYRTDGVVESPEAVSPWELEVSIWLPAEGGAPAPVLFFGHGLNDSRGSGAALHYWFGDLGTAVVSVDALHHGDHPTAGDNAMVMAFFDFFAIDTETVSLRPLRLRDNLRQSNYDRLQLLALLASDPDIDGDGAADLDMDQLAYVGISLGAIMGSELLALSGRFDAAVLAVGGARFTAIVENGADYELLYLVFEEVLGSPDETARMLPVIQTAVDGGDPVNYAPHVLGDRIDILGGSPPHLLMNSALGDTTVPRQSAYCLARALRCPIAGADRFEEGSLPVVSLPVSGNLGDGAVTAGFMQLDRATDSDGSVVLATHENGSTCPETLSQERHFLETWLTQGVPEIEDPYESLGTPPLEVEAP